jgi:hypothetical protein
MNVLNAALLLCGCQQRLDQRQDLRPHVGQQNLARAVHAVGQRCFETGDALAQVGNLFGRHAKAANAFLILGRRRWWKAEMIP